MRGTHFNHVGVATGRGHVRSLTIRDGRSPRVGRVYAAVRQAGRRPRGRFADLLIAAVALAEGLSLLTRNPVDFVGLESLVDVVEV